MKNLEESILKVVNAKGYRPLKPRKIADQLGLSKDEAVEVRRVVKRLVRVGRLRYASNHLVLPAAEGSGARGQGSGAASGAKDALTLTLSQRERGPRDGTLAQRERGSRDGTIARTERGPRNGTLARTERGPRDGTLARTERGPRDEPDDPLTLTLSRRERGPRGAAATGCWAFFNGRKRDSGSSASRRADNRRKGR